MGDSLNTMLEVIYPRWNCGYPSKTLRVSRQQNKIFVKVSQLSRTYLVNVLAFHRAHPAMTSSNHKAFTARKRRCPLKNSGWKTTVLLTYVSFGVCTFGDFIERTHSQPSLSHVFVVMEWPCKGSWGTLAEDVKVIYYILQSVTVTSILVYISGSFYWVQTVSWVSLRFDWSLYSTIYVEGLTVKNVSVIEWCATYSIHSLKLACI